MAHIIALGNDGTRYRLRENGQWEIAPASVSDAGFRGLPWGTTRADVKSRETLPLEEEAAGYLSYEVILDSRQYLAIYIFISDQLVRAKYLLSETYVNSQNYIHAADALRETVTKKYGAPTSHNEYWSGDLYRDDPSEFGMAVLSGELSRYTEWLTPETRILLAMDGENYAAQISVEYISVGHRDLEMGARAADLLDNF